MYHNKKETNTEKSFTFVVANYRGLSISWSFLSVSLNLR